MLLLILKLLDIRDYQREFVNILVFPGNLVNNQADELSEETYGSLNELKALLRVALAFRRVSTFSS